MMNAKTIAITAICIAVVTVLVAIVQVPIAATGGFIHAGTIAEIFVAIAFGPIIGMVAAGIGAALADLILGYGSFAPLTLVAHGVLGLLAGWLGYKKGWAGMLAGWIIGGVVLVAIYFVGQATIYRLGWALAAAEILPNLLQVAFGVLGIMLFEAVKRVFPQIEQLATDATFTEESV